MRKITNAIFILMFALAASISAPAQWCTVTTAIPYSPDMPGITNVTFSTINRNSLPIENYPNNSYVNTGISTTLTAGQTYSFSITHTRDAVNFPTARNNIRVWIDFNHDYSFDDPGEMVVSLDYQTYGTSTAMITIPASVTVGPTRMRVTAKMSADAGHSIPTSCDSPPDPLGYHGEIEDYDVVLTSSVGINNVTATQSNFSLSPNPASTDVTVNFVLEKPSEVAFNIYDVMGKRIYFVNPVTKTSGTHKMNLNLSDMNIAGPGVYLVEMITNDKKSVQRFMVK
jgi:bacillolysin